MLDFNDSPKFVVRVRYPDLLIDDFYPFYTMNDLRLFCSSIDLDNYLLQNEGSEFQILYQSFRLIPTR